MCPDFLDSNFSKLSVSSPHSALMKAPARPCQSGRYGKEFGFEHAATIGLTYAAIGFFFAFFVGVPIANWGIRKGISAHGPRELPQDLLKGILSKNQKQESAGELTLHSGNIDTLAFQTALIGLTYIITYFVVKSLGMLLGPEVAKMLWGFFFFFGLGFAILIRWLMGKAEIDYLINSGIQRRITGWSVDYLIVSTVAAIQLIVVWKFFFPIALISIR